MAIHSVKHYQFIFTVNNNNQIETMEAHVFALCREEADLLFSQKVPKVWAMLDVHEKGVARHFMIAGKRYNSNKSYVASLAEYVRPLDDNSLTPFSDFVKLYRASIANLPLLDFKKQLWDHKPHHIPTAEQFEILADETGEYVEAIKAKAMRQFYAYAVNKAITQFGRKAVEKIVGGPLDYAERGYLSDDAKARLERAIPNFGVVRRYTMTAPELLYFYDLVNGTFSSRAIYTGEKSLMDFTKRELKHLHSLDTRFAELLV